MNFGIFSEGDWILRFSLPPPPPSRSPDEFGIFFRRPINDFHDIFLLPTGEFCGLSCDQLAKSDSQLFLRLICDFNISHEQLLNIWIFSPRPINEILDFFFIRAIDEFRDVSRDRMVITIYFPQLMSWFFISGDWSCKYVRVRHKWQ